MESIRCIQGQVEGSRGPLNSGLMSGGLSQDILQSFGVQESQEDNQPLHPAPSWEQLIPPFSGEIANFLLNWRSITGPTGHRLSLISEPSIWPLSQ